MVERTLLPRRVAATEAHGGRPPASRRRKLGHIHHQIHGHNIITTITTLFVLASLREPAALTLIQPLTSPSPSPSHSHSHSHSTFVSQVRSSLRSGCHAASGYSLALQQVNSWIRPHDELLTTTLKHYSDTFAYLCVFRFFTVPSATLCHRFPSNRFRHTCNISKSRELLPSRPSPPCEPISPDT